MELRNLNQHTLAICPFFNNIYGTVPHRKGNPFHHDFSHTCSMTSLASMKTAIYHCLHDCGSVAPKISNQLLPELKQPQGNDSLSDQPQETSSVFAHC